jgi:hypothetical protein
MIANRVEGLSDDIYDEIDRNSLFTSKVLDIYSGSL